MNLLAVDTALARILAQVPPPVTELVDLAHANSRVLTQPLTGGHDQPPFDASSMDGYAVRSADVAGDLALEIIGTSQAGAGFGGVVGPGQCVRIFTGAPVPAGADAVVMQEEATVDGGRVRFSRRPAPGLSIRLRGYDFMAGQQLVPAGVRLNPFTLTLAAAANRAQLAVARRPQIGVLATGDELVLPGAPLQADQIIAANSFGLMPLLSPYAETVIDLGIARDDRQHLTETLERAFAAPLDILVTTGGASVGDHDIVQDILTDLGVELDFWRINMRPGKPLMFGTRGRTLVFGLPGNPVSAMVTATILIKPALRRWLGLTVPVPTPLRLPLAGPTPPNTARRHFLRATMVLERSGVAVLPINQTDSGHTASLAKADMLIIQPEFDPGQPGGTLVDCLPLDAF